jgi:hypothetical protein
LTIYDRRIVYAVGGTRGPVAHQEKSRAARDTHPNELVVLLSGYGGTVYEGLNGTGHMTFIDPFWLSRRAAGTERDERGPNHRLLV